MVKPKMPEEKFITAAQAAEILSVSVSTLKKFIVLGKTQGY